MTRPTSEPQELPATGVSLFSDIPLLARRVSAALLPQRLPRIEGMSFQTELVPSTDNGVGLFYDSYVLSNDITCLVFFESGLAGPAGALIASLAKAILNGHIRSGLQPNVVVQRTLHDLEEALGPLPAPSLFVGYIDLHANRIAWCGSSAIPPILVRSGSKDASFLQPIQTVAKNYFEEKLLFINPGDRFFLVSHDTARAFGGVSAITGMVSQKSFAEITSSLAAGKGERFILCIEALTESRRSLIKRELGFELDDPVYLQYLSYLEDMEKVIAVILKSMDQHGFADDDIRKMKIILTELIVNGLVHGNGKNTLCKVTVGHLVNRERIAISIMDEGDGFDPGTVPDPTLPENLVKDSGRGLYIVKCYVDELRFNAKGNRVTVIKANR